MKNITYEELMKLANENYNNGGDAIYECWSKKDLDEYIEEVGSLTRQQALDLIAFYGDMEREVGVLTDDEVQEENKTEEDEIPVYPEDYSYFRSAASGDYSPSNPWDAPGMKVSDFIHL